MFNTVKIHGHDLLLVDPTEEGIVTDVMIITRIVFPSVQDDDITISFTEHTTSTIQTGMLARAQHLYTDHMTSNLIQQHLDDDQEDDDE